MQTHADHTVVLPPRSGDQGPQHIGRRIERPGDLAAVSTRHGGGKHEVSVALEFRLQVVLPHNALVMDFRDGFRPAAGIGIGISQLIGRQFGQRRAIVIGGVVIGGHLVPQRRSEIGQHVAGAIQLSK
jgi:hypothetical protein